MTREFIINILFLLFINLLIKPAFIFGIDLAVQNRAPEGAYGLYFALLFLAYIFQIICDFGIQNFTNTHVSRHPWLMPKYFPNLLALKIILSAAYLLLAPLGAWLIFGYGWHEMPLLFILLLNQALVQMTFFLRSNISGLGHYRLDSLLSAADKLLMLLTCSVLLWVFPPDFLSMERFALAQTLALAATMVWVLMMLQRRISFSLRPSWAHNWRAGWPALLFLFKKSLPFATIILLMTAYTRLDAVLLERLLPDGKLHADVYAGAYRLLDACNMLGYLFASLLLPMFARLLQTAPDGSAARPLVSMSFKLIWAGSVTLATSVFFARSELIQLMMPERASAYRWDTLGLLIWAFVPVCTTYIFSTLLTAGRQLGRMNRFFAIGIVLDIALNLVLVPRYQAFGAAIAALSTQCFIAVAMVWLCVREFGYQAGRRSLVEVAGFVVYLLGIHVLLFEKTTMPWPFKTAVGLVAAAAGLFLFRLLDWRAIRSNL